MSDELIFGEFVDAWKAGERPDLDAYLDRADPADRDDIAAAIEQWLLVAPDPSYDEQTLAEIRAEPALAAAFAKAADAAHAEPLATRLKSLRERAGVAIADLAARLDGSFGTGGGERTTSYLDRLESGELDERRVSRRLLDWLADTLGAGAGVLEPRPAAAHTWFRAGDDADRTIEGDIQLLSHLATTPAPEDEMDELDRLFTGGPGG